jgi:hypothetical protein
MEIRESEMQRCGEIIEGHVAAFLARLDSRMAVPA